MILPLNKIEAIRQARRPIKQSSYRGGPEAPRRATWPAEILLSTPMYTKICIWWYGVVALYQWRPVFDSLVSDTPSYMPLMKPVDTPLSPDGFIWVPDLLNGETQWVPSQLWWNYFGPGQGRKVTGMWAINTAEFQYRPDINRHFGGSSVIAGTLVGMWVGKFRDFGICPVESRIPYMTPMFHHYRTPTYEYCI